MKKIVALVLSLVLALSLCATAFAAGSQSATFGSGVYGLTNGSPDASNLVTKEYDTVKALADKNCGGRIAHYTYETYDTVSKYFVVENEEGKTDLIPYYNYTMPEGYHFKMVDNDYVYEEIPDWYTVYLIPTDTKSEANCALYKNGAMVTWLYATTDEAVYYEHTAKAVKASTAKPNCTTDQYLEDGYVDVTDGTFYIDGTSVPLNVDGKIVWADKAENYNYVIHASHIFAKGVKNDKTGYDVATCLICKGEFACTNDEMVATKNGYKISTGFSYSNADAREVYDANKYENGYDFAWGQTYATDYEYCWALKAGTTQEIDTTQPGVDSAKTFDAGVAMYVGMSLLSVAGGAVVIGKKKEF